MISRTHRISKRFEKRGFEFLARAEFRIVIKTEIGYKQTLECIELMGHSLESPRQEVLPHNPKLFELCVEGPREELKRLKAEANEYLRANAKQINALIKIKAGFQGRLGLYCVRLL